MNILDNYLPIEYGLLSQLLPLLDIKPGETFCDLGSGDGRVVIAAAQLGAVSTGIEINPTLISESRQNILSANVSATIVESNFHDVDLSSYDIVYTYLCHDTLHILLPKYQQTAKPGSRMFMWCGYGTHETITARARYSPTYAVDEQEIPGKAMYTLTSEIDGAVHHVLIVTTPHE